MNNNRNNNRRRGRNNNRGQGGGHQQNRIDSRARGNAPQLLEKYKKLAHDSSMNDDRVQTEYYLQFADHYFRVIADGKAQKEEARAKREEREQAADDDQDDDGGDNNGRENNGRDNRSRGARNRRNDGDDAEQAAEGERGVEGDDAPEDPANPFTRREKPARARKAPAKARAKSRPAADDGASDEAPKGDGFDPDALPPSISGDDEQPAPKKRKRVTRSRRTDDGDGGTLEAVN